MSHARKQIRTAFKEILKGGRNWKTVLETRIIPTRQVMPFLMVFSDSEPTIGLNVQNPNIYERDLSISVAAVVKIGNDTTTLEDQMDVIAIEIEEKLTTTALVAKIPNKSISLTLDNQSYTVVVDVDDNIDYAEVLINWTVKYFTQEGQPETLL